ncbi:hypothetical protein N431DRAFT_563398 [Stipitochalara longipes BDJ]|nr:hypothetical protein N431DRAFT_563398 [Stipitochalara longipes BDJ]
MQHQKERSIRTEQLPGHRAYSLRCFAKVWYKGFFTHQDLVGKDETPAVEVLKELAGVGNKLSLFLCNDEGSNGPCEADAIQRFCKDASLDEIERGIGQAGSRRACWVDERSSADLIGRGNARSCKNMLTATGLLRHLRQPRYNHGNDPDVERRLIYIADLTPDFILALAATVPFLEAQALRDALCKHVAFEPSVRVHMPSYGAPTFQMAFHLPFFALRKLPPPPESVSTTKIRGKRLRNRKNLSLLNAESRGDDDHEEYLLYPAQTSCALFGVDEWQYTACSFVDTEHESSGGNELYDWNDDDDAQGLDEDPLISISTAPVPARFPIWRPRQYYAKALEVSAEDACREWSRLAYRLEEDQKTYKRFHPFTRPSASQCPKERGEMMQKGFDWTAQRLDLLNELLHVLSGLVDEWDTFISPNGDIGYFSDLDEFPSNSNESRELGCPGSSLRNIKQTFEKLEMRRRRLQSLKESLIKDFGVLKLRLFLEGNHATEQASFTSNFLIWVLYPITLTVSIFSMQPAVIPFDLTKEWLLFSVFILIGVMSLIYWAMKKWVAWRKKITLWMKVRQMEGEGSRVETRDYLNDVIIPKPVLYNSKVWDDDEESLGTRATLGSRGPWWGRK